MTIALALAGVLAVFVLLFIRIVPRKVKIIDGDTIEVRSVRWRLTGFDAPEWNQPGGAAATKALRKMLHGHFALAFVRSRDAYGRPLATIYTLRGPLSWRMTFSGHAHGEGIIPYILALVARIFRRGLWKGRHHKVHPRYWRAGIRP